MSPLTLTHRYQSGQLIYMLNLINHTTAGLDYQLITTITRRKHGTFHPHLSLLDQVLARPVKER